MVELIVLPRPPSDPEALSGNLLMDWKANFFCELISGTEQLLNSLTRSYTSHTQTHRTPYFHVIAVGCSLNVNNKRQYSAFNKMLIYIHHTNFTFDKINLTTD